MSARLEPAEAVLVVAETLSNGAPHPLHGRTGVVLEVRTTGICPVQVHIDPQPGRPGRTTWFPAAELERAPVEKVIT